MMLLRTLYSYMALISQFANLDNSSLVKLVVVSRINKSARA